MITDSCSDGSCVTFPARTPTPSTARMGTGCGLTRSYTAAPWVGHGVEPAIEEAVMDQITTPPDTLLVIFGANGDLAKRKLLPALYNLDEEGLLPKQWRVIGTARSEVSDEEFRALAREAIAEHER